MTTLFDEALINDPLDKERQLQEAKERIAGPIPLIANPLSCLVTLPRGLLRGDTWESEAEVRELNGADEEALARVRDSVEFFDQVLAYGTVRIGNVDLSQKPISERQMILQELLIGDRAQLLMAVIKATYGDNKTLNFKCQICEAEQEVDLILSEDFKPKEIAEPFKLTYSMTTSKGDNVEYRLVTGADQSEALRKKGATLAEQNSIILSRVIARVNSGLVPDPLGYARRMSLSDRSTLLQLLIKEQPIMDLSVTTTCLGCGGEQVLSLGWSDLFRP